MTIKPEVRTKVLEMHRQGLSRNRIAYELSGQVSSGSVSAILKEWRESQQTSSETSDRGRDLAVAPSKISDNNQITTVPPEANIDSTSNNQDQGPSISDDDEDFDPTDDNIDMPLNIDSKTAELEKQIQILRLENEMLLGEINTLKADKKTVEDFTMAKEVVNTFKKYGYNPAAIYQAFIQVQDVATEREYIRKLRQEIKEEKELVKEEREFLDRRLEEIGVDGIETLKQHIIVFTTLQQFGIGTEELISVYRHLHYKTNRGGYVHNY